MPIFFVWLLLPEQALIFRIMVSGAIFLLFAPFVSWVMERMIGKEERGKEELERVVSYKELPIKYWRWQQMGQYKVTECVAVCIPFLLITGTWRALGWKEGIIGIALFSFYFFLLGPLNGYFLEKRVLR